MGVFSQELKCIAILKMTKLEGITIGRHYSITHYFGIYTVRLDNGTNFNMDSNEFNYYFMRVEDFRINNLEKIIDVK